MVETIKGFRSVVGSEEPTRPDHSRWLVSDSVFKDRCDGPDYPGPATLAEAPGEVKEIFSSIRRRGRRLARPGASVLGVALVRGRRNVLRAASAVKGFRDRNNVILQNRPENPEKFRCGIGRVRQGSGSVQTRSPSPTPQPFGRARAESGRRPRGALRPAVATKKGGFGLLAGREDQSAGRRRDFGGRGSSSTAVSAERCGPA